jgi:hypothetical protein
MDIKDVIVDNEYMLFIQYHGVGVEIMCYKCIVSKKLGDTPEKMEDLYKKSPYVDRPTDDGFSVMHRATFEEFKERYEFMSRCVDITCPDGQTRTVASCHLHEILTTFERLEHYWIYFNSKYIKAQMLSCDDMEIIFDIEGCPIVVQPHDIKILVRNQYDMFMEAKKK